MPFPQLWPGRLPKSYTTSWFEFICFTWTGMDRLSKEKRSWNMSRIGSKNTMPERIVRSMLHRAGFRFRLHVAGLPGRPDIVLPKWKTVIFVHGCFWHRHPGCKFAYTPKTRRDFWLSKFAKNVAHDAYVHRALEGMGWHPIVLWECELVNPDMALNRLRTEIAASFSRKYCNVK